MKKPALLVFTVLFLFTKNIDAQKIYGLVDNMFCSFDIGDYSKDTLFTFPGTMIYNVDFNSAIDRYNGLYFLVGTLPGQQGTFHILDLIESSIESYSIYPPRKIDYDFRKNRLVYERDGDFFSLDLTTRKTKLLAQIEDGNYIVSGQSYTYIPQKNHYLYLDDLVDENGDTKRHYLALDADSGDILCQRATDEIDGSYYIGTGLLTTNLTGEVMGHHNGKLGIIDPCTGIMKELSHIPFYGAWVVHSRTVFDHNTNTYILPYKTVWGSYDYKLAFVDMENDELVKRIDQPWNGKMKLQQIYDKPTPPIVFTNDTLYVPVGKKYLWYLNSILIEENAQNYFVPAMSGTYKAAIEFREYTALSTEIEINVSNSLNIGKANNFNIFPNPVLKLLNIEYDKDQFPDLSIIIYNSSGSLRKEFKNESMLDLSALESGNYFIEFWEANGKLTTKSFIKQ